MDNEKPEPGKQMQLIDVDPENKKEILKSARKYRDALKTRVAALAIEVAEKENLLALVKEAKILPDSDGCYKFTLDDATFSVKPRDFLLTVKFAGDDEEE